MESATTRQSTQLRKIGKSSDLSKLRLDSDSISALGTQALLEAVVHYDQFLVKSVGQRVQHSPLFII